MILLDGNSIRSTIHNHFDLSPESIKNLSVILLIYVKKSLHDYIIVSVIAPFEKIREYGRKLLVITI